MKEVDVIRNEIFFFKNSLMIDCDSNDDDNDEGSKEE